MQAFSWKLNWHYNLMFNFQRIWVSSVTDSFFKLQFNASSMCLRIWLNDTIFQEEFALCRYHRTFQNEFASK